jgi:uncharacterized protein with PIN domain
MRGIGTILLVLFALGGAALAQGGSERSCGSLEDCDAVIRARPGLAAYERRGYLHLMRRDLDNAIADFTAAIGIDAARAFSLYGRGMARLISGDAAGQNEMEAAIMLQRDIAEEFKAYGAK